jgi:alkylation response protein AidB-like acyl-CoA dehydrogenase
VFFDEARTSSDLVVGDVDGGWNVVMGTLGNERAGATVLPFQALFERELRQLLNHVGRRGLSEDASTRQRVARAWGGLRILQLNNDRLLTSVLQGQHPGPESSIGKLYWANWHRDFGELMVDVLGADAMITNDDGTYHPMVRSFLNSRAETIYGGANEIQRNILGERVLGLPKEPR